VHELQHRGRKAAELSQQLQSPLRVTLDDVELVVVERRGLLEDPLGDGELAHVVEQASDRQRAEAPRRETELFAHLDRAQGDSTGVFLR
jgi:hypothetical protein